MVVIYVISAIISIVSWKNILPWADANKIFFYKKRVCEMKFL